MVFDGATTLRDALSTGATNFWFVGASLSAALATARQPLKSEFIVIGYISMYFLH